VSRGDLSRLKIFLRGGLIDVPIWALILEAAQGDPLRASEIEANLTQEWWEYWRVWRNETAKANEELAKANSSG
jgi:hypothetical protein